MCVCVCACTTLQCSRHQSWLVRAQVKCVCERMRDYVRVDKQHLTGTLERTHRRRRGGEEKTEGERDGGRETEGERARKRKEGKERERN